MTENRDKQLEASRKEVEELKEDLKYLEIEKNADISVLEDNISVLKNKNKLSRENTALKAELARKDESWIELNDILDGMDGNNSLEPLRDIAKQALEKTLRETAD